MSIVNDILKAKTAINNRENMIQHYNDTITSYEIKKYQKEYFYFMENIYMGYLHGMTFKPFEVLNGIILEIKNIKKVPNYAMKQGFNLFNFELHFLKNNKVLMMVTINPETDLEKKVENGRVVDIVGVRCLNVVRYTSDEKKFVSAVSAFKYTMENHEDIFSELENRLREEYLTIVSDHYYESLTFLNRMKDVKEMIRTYMENPSSYKPIITEKIKTPDYSKMNLVELIAEFNKGVPYEEMSNETKSFCEQVMDFFPNIEIKSKEIYDFFSKITDNKDDGLKIPDDVFDSNMQEQILDNNGYCYMFRIYNGSSQMLIQMKKGTQSIGSLYYWNHRRYTKSIHLEMENIGFGKRGFNGLNEETIPDFCEAVKNLSENWNEIVSRVLSVYYDSFDSILKTYEKKAEKLLEEQKKAEKDFYERQTEIEKYF